MKDFELLQELIENGSIECLMGCNDYKLLSKLEADGLAKSSAGSRYQVVRFEITDSGKEFVSSLA